MKEDSEKIVEMLAVKALDLSNRVKGDIEKSCWILVHEHRHGVRPSEYDIREIDEDLYLSVLAKAKLRIN